MNRSERFYLLTKIAFNIEKVLEEFRSFKEHKGNSSLIRDHFKKYFENLDKETKSKINDLCLQKIKTLNSLGSYRKRLDYLLELENQGWILFLGKGSSRIAYLMPDGNTVLKVAHNAKGIAQNQTEADPYIGNETVNSAIEQDEDHDTKWLTARYAKPVSGKRFKELTGFEFGEFSVCLKYFFRYKSEFLMKNMKEPESYERIKNKEFFTDVIDSMGNYNLSADDLSQIKHYGEYKEDENSPPRIILIDPGATEDIMRQFYKRK